MPRAIALHRLIRAINRSEPGPAGQRGD